MNSKRKVSDVVGPTPCRVAHSAHKSRYLVLCPYSAWRSAHHQACVRACVRVCVCLRACVCTHFFSVYCKECENMWVARLAAAHAG